MPVRRFRPAPGLTRLIDTLDRFDACATAEDMWQAAARSFAAFGASHLTVGAATPCKLDRVTVRTDLPEALMSDYLGQRLDRNDPWMAHSAQSPHLDLLDTGQETGDAPAHVSFRQRNLFRDHGFAQVLLVPVRTTGTVAGVVLYSADGFAADVLSSPAGAGGLRLTAALFATRCDPYGEPGRLGRSYTFGHALGPREAEALKWAASGLQTARIAEKMGIQPVTVSKHFRRARRKLGARTLAEALAIALRERLIGL